MEYLQEEEDPTLEKVEEEQATVHLLVSGLFSVTPNYIYIYIMYISFISNYS